MKQLKTGLLFAGVVGALVLFGNVATAQDNKDGGNKDGKKGGRGASVQQRLDMMSERLTLTDEQKPKVKTVLEDGQKKMAELRQDSSLTGDDRREKFASVRQEEDKKLKEILTPEQQEKWAKMREEFRNRGPGGKKAEAKKDGTETKKD